MEGRSVFAQSSPLRGSPGGSSVSLSSKGGEQGGLLVNTSPLFAGKNTHQSLLCQLLILLAQEMVG